MRTNTTYMCFFQSNCIKIVAAIHILSGFTYRTSRADFTELTDFYN